MKKIPFFILLLVVTASYSQKKKKAPVVKKAVPTILAKDKENTVELINNNLYFFVKNAEKKDTLLLKKYETKTTPIDLKITSFLVKDVPLYCVTWNEKNGTTTKLKKEDITNTESQIWNAVLKSLLISNTQSVTKIVETVFLDKRNTASETQERTRNAGYNFALLPNGDFVLKNKTEETKYSYNPTSAKYEVFKPTSAPVKAKVKSKRR